MRELDYNMTGSLARDIMSQFQESCGSGTSPEFWLKMQGQYDLWHARKKTPKVRRFPRAANPQPVQEL